MKVLYCSYHYCSNNSDSCNAELFSVSSSVVRVYSRGYGLALSSGKQGTSGSHSISSTSSQNLGPFTLVPDCFTVLSSIITGSCALALGFSSEFTYVSLGSVTASFCRVFCDCADLCFLHEQIIQSAVLPHQPLTLQCLSVPCAQPVFLLLVSHHSLVIQLWASQPSAISTCLMFNCCLDKSPLKPSHISVSASGSKIKNQTITVTLL